MTRPDWCPADVWLNSAQPAIDLIHAFDLTVEDVAHGRADESKFAQSIMGLVACSRLAESERSAAIADKHAEILRGNFARYEAIAVDGVANEIRGAHAN